jgi:membrane-associated phospholipid phosphatase
MRFLRAALALCCIGRSLSAQSPNPAGPVLRGWEAVAIVGLTAGAMAIDQSVRHALRRETKQLPSFLVRAGDMLGNARYIGPGLIGGVLTGIVVGDSGVERVSTRALESTAVSGVAALALKSAIGRRRPDVAPNTAFSFRPFAFKGNSFPSGHTAIAFAVATSLASETKDHWSDALFYGAGTLTAFARINDDKHWLSDTVLGAAVGIVAARLVQRWNRKSPTGTPVVALSFSF